MGVSGLKCVRCGCMYPAEDRYFCEACGGILEVAYDTGASGCERLSTSFAYMPVAREEMAGFGTTPTPLLRSRRLARGVGLEKLYFKCETANLTGSFKDRPVAVAVAMAQRLGYRRVVAASSGNAAAATAACAARQGLECVIVLPASTPPEKVRQTAAYGASVFKVEGPYSNSYRVALDLAREHGVYNVTTTFLNPYAWKATSWWAMSFTRSLAACLSAFMFRWERDRCWQGSEEGWTSMPGGIICHAARA